MSLKPFEFIDFSKFKFAPVKASRTREDPLALDIKKEPVIKQEPVDPSYTETPMNSSCFKEDLLDKVLANQDPLSLSISVNRKFPLTDYGPVNPKNIKREPPDLDYHENKDPLSLSISVNRELPSIDYGPVNPTNIKREPPDLNYHVNGGVFPTVNSGSSSLPSSCVEESLRFIGPERSNPENIQVKVTPAAKGGEVLPEQWFSNPDCEKIISKDLNNIMNLSNNLTEFIERCNLDFPSYTTLQSEYCKKLPGRKPNIVKLSFSCHHCGYHCYQKQHIMYHIISQHGGKKPFSCRDCKLKFVQQGALNRHIIEVHNLEKPFKCDRCDFSCGRKEGLKRHNASIHDNIRPHSCPECQFKSVRKYHLDNHIKIVHRRERPFPCSMCNYSASRKHHLVDHVYHKHKGVKRFPCQECPFKSNQKSNLKQHVDAVHKKLKPFICHHCDHRTTHKGSLRGHITSFHIKKLHLSS